MKLIDPGAINLSIYSSNEITETLNLQDIYKFGSNITRTDGSKLTDTYKYRLQFTPKDNNYNIEVYRATVSYKHKTTKAILKTESLLKNTDGFILNASGTLTSASVNKNINSINNMVTSSHLTNVDKGGFTIRNGYTNGSGTININGYGNQTLIFMSNCEMSEINRSDIITKGCLWKDNELILRTDYDGYKEITIEIEANKFAFTLNTDTVLNFYMFDYDNNKYMPYSISGAGSVFETKQTLVPRKIKMFLNKELKLELNNKSRYYPSKMGVNFCGYRIYDGYRLIRNGSKRKIKKRIKKWKKDNNMGCLDRKKMMLSFNSWSSHIRHANSYHIYQKIYREIENIMF